MATYAYGLTIYESRGEMVAREPKMLTLPVGADEAIIGAHLEGPYLLALSSTFIQ